MSNITLLRNRVLTDWPLNQVYNRPMKIISWNVNGIRAVHRKEMFMPFIKEHKPDILCLQETKAQQSQSELDLMGYEEYWHSATKKGYSGTAIFSKQVPENVLFGMPKDIVEKYGLATDSYGDPNEEGRVIAADMGPFYVVSVYTPNSKEDLSRLPLRHKHWDPAFLAYMKRLEEEKPVIFCGDLNVAHTPDDLARPKQNVGVKGFTDEEREGIDQIVEAGFVDTFRLFTEGNGHYSWWSHFAKARERNVGWRIDYIFTSKALVPKVKSAEILASVMGSDHCPVSITLG
ncbi:MAG: exoA [Parcubacteria group bacterium]|nr:exoA [Parcubacteria group bacterium]